MPHQQEIVDNLNGFLASTQPGQDERIQESASEYAKLCRQANDRLRKCADALRRGLRSDAIQLAEAEPNLLDLVASLDFPDLPAWREACRSFGFQEPPALLIEAATVLNEAYSIEQPVQTLMARHRLLALGRAPLNERLAVMRKIAELDPSSAFWDDDIRLFEQARLTEVRSQIKALVAAGNRATIAHLHDEVETSEWRANVPADLRRILKDAASQLTTAQGLTELQRLLPKLNDAYGAMAYDHCKSLLGQWAATVAANDVVVPQGLQEQVDPIFGWVEEEDLRREQQAAFEQACDALQQALDTDQPTPALERAFQALMAFHRDLPEDLEDRYRHRLLSRANALRHRRRLTYAGMAAGFIVIVGAGTLFAYQSLLSREVADSQKALVLALAEAQQGAIDKATHVRKELVDQHPRIARAPQIIKALSDLDSGIAAELQRVEDFKQHMQAAETAGSDRPDDSELKQATALAKLPAEKERIELLNSRIAEARAKAQEDFDRTFSADGTALSADIEKQLSFDLLDRDAAAYTKMIDVMGKKVEDLRQRSGVSAALKQVQMAALDAVISQKQHSVQTRQALTEAWRKVQQFGTTAEQHAAALKQFITAFPDDPHRASFERCIGQLATAQSVEDWSALVGSWPKMVPADLQAAKTRIEEIQKYQTAHQSSGLAESIQAYLNYLSVGVEVAAPEGPWKGGFRKLLANPLVGDLRCVEALDGNRYYLTNTEKVTEGKVAGEVGSVSFMAITSPDLTTPVRIQLGRRNLLKSTTPIKSPQAVFADAQKDRLLQLDFTGWDSFGLDVLVDLQQSKTMSPVLKAMLLQQIILANQPVATWSGQVGFMKISDALGDMKVEDMEWLDPAKKLDSDLAKKLETYFDKTGQLVTAARAEIQRKITSAINDAQIAIAGEGILLRTSDKWEIFTSMPAPAGSVGYVIGLDRHLIEIARVQEKQWIIDPVKVAAATDGSLVFIMARGNRPSKPETPRIDTNKTGVPKADVGNIPTVESGLVGGGTKSSFAGVSGNAHKIVYLCDASGTMQSVFGSLRKELKTSVGSLGPGQSFNVIFFTGDNVIAYNKGGLVATNDDNKKKLDDFVEDISPKEGTNPFPAIEFAFSNKPELIYVVTDGFDQVDSLEAVYEKFKNLNAGPRKIAINTILLSSDPTRDKAMVDLLTRIAKDNGGEMKAVSKDSF